MIFVFACLIVLANIGWSIRYVSSDTPANCSYEDARGQWLFDVCFRSDTDCSNGSDEQFTFELLYPNLVNVLHGYGSTGTWTLIYNQGFEINVAHRKWLVLFDFGPNGESYCDRGRPGWTHDRLLRQWYRFTARKTTGKLNSPKLLPRMNTAWLDQPYRVNHSFVDQINKAQRSWMAIKYPSWDNLTMRDVLNRIGGLNSRFPKPPQFFNRLTMSKELLEASSSLPVAFDWRTPMWGNESAVTPVRNQGNCGSCYAFASTAAMESRIRILSNFTRRPILSPQDIVDCSPYSEGCDGGFPYLIAGKYAEDFGVSEEHCDPYTGQRASVCPVKPECPRYYSTNYRYVGGYYGACNEFAMKMELIHGGPFPIGFQVYDDFLHYKSGIYQHTGLGHPITRFEPFELTNHAVLLVGYGFDQDAKLPYWIVKNSWGTEWGEDGFFRILRGSDECGVESLAVAFDPVL